MKQLWIPDEITYDGTQLHSGWIRERTGAAGDAIAAFVGPADVPIEHMVDLEDVAANAPIFSRRMLHLLIEHEGTELLLAVARQRLLIAIIAEALRARNIVVDRRGDDCFVDERKISVSIATHAPRSTLIHTGLNVIGEGAPVPAIGLDALGIAPHPFAEAIMARYAEEIAAMAAATRKVRPVP